MSAAAPAPEDAPVDWIDRTNQPLGEIGKDYQLTADLTSLCLINNRISKIERLEPCTNLCELTLRQNSISRIECLDTLHSLADLDLYMNAIEHVPASCFKNNPLLMRLDLSFNQLRSLDDFPSHHLSNLQELFLIGNKVRKITGLSDMPKLTMLELGDNRIRVIENLDSLTALQGLWLGRNKISAITNLDALTNLRRLSLQSNRITRIEGLAHLTCLEELYLSHNGLTSMQGVEQLSSLFLLDVGSNEIERIEGVDHLPELKEFWFNNNKLAQLDDLKLLSNIDGLQTIYLEGNPVAAREDYQKAVLDILPHGLEQLDALLVSDVKMEILRKAEAATS